MAGADEILGKKDVVAAIAEKTGQTKADVERFLGALTDTVVSGVADGKVVRLPGFASFKPKVRAARTAYNPSSGKKIEVPEKNVVKIYPAKGFSDIISRARKR